jgi:hypothetical protein
MGTNNLSEVYFKLEKRLTSGGGAGDNIKQS